MTPLLRLKRNKSPYFKHIGYFYTSKAEIATDYAYNLLFLLRKAYSYQLRGRALTGGYSSQRTVNKTTKSYKRMLYGIKSALPALASDLAVALDFPTGVYFLSCEL